MDRTVVAALEEAGVPVAGREVFPLIGIMVDPSGKPHPIRGVVPVVVGRASVPITPKRISELWAGNAVPPDFSAGPTKEFLPIFVGIESVAADYCAITRRRIRDVEFHRLYDLLRRRPDGTDGNPLFSYLQTATALQLSLRDVSRPEFEAVLRRLAKSARTFSDGCTSTNYLERALSVFHAVPD